MRGIHKLNGAANTAQARRDYAWLLNLAAQHDLESLIPSAGERPGWRAFDKAAKKGIENLLLAKPELREKVRGIYPGLVGGDGTLTVKKACNCIGDTCTFHDGYGIDL